MWWTCGGGGGATTGHFVELYLRVHVRHGMAVPLLVTPVNACTAAVPMPACLSLTDTGWLIVDVFPLSANTNSWDVGVHANFFFFFRKTPMRREGTLPTAVTA